MGIIQQQETIVIEEQYIRYFHTILGAQSQYLQYISRLAKPSGGVLGSDGPYRAVEEVVYLEDVHAMRHRVAHDPALATNVGLDLREGGLDRVEVWRIWGQELDSHSPASRS